MSYKNVEYTKLEIEKEDEISNGFKSQPFNSDLDHLDENKVNDESEPNKPGLWNFRFYQNLFDIDTNDVLKRIIYSFIPNPKISFLKSIINRKPDLYGPFWTCTTLILTIAIAGNVANYFQFSEHKQIWRYEFRKLSLAALAIYSYWWVMPLFVWGVARFYKLQQLSFLELLTLFGYSLVIYIPISVLWVVQIAWLQWLLVGLALVLSGFVLVLSVWGQFASTASNPEGSKRLSLIIVAVVALMHALLAVGFMLYFFHVPSMKNNSSTTTRIKQM